MELLIRIDTWGETGWEGERSLLTEKVRKEERKNIRASAPLKREDCT